MLQVMRFLILLVIHARYCFACARTKGGSGGGQTPGGGGSPSSPSTPKICAALTSFTPAAGFMNIVAGTTSGSGSSATFTCPSGSLILQPGGGAATSSSATLSCANGVWTLSDGTAFDPTTTSVSCGTACTVPSVDLVAQWFIQATVTFTTGCDATASCTAPAVLAGIMADGTEVDGIASPTLTNGVWMDAGGTQYSGIQCKACTGCPAPPADVALCNMVIGGGCQAYTTLTPDNSGDDPDVPVQLQNCDSYVIDCPPVTGEDGIPFYGFTDGSSFGCPGDTCDNAGGLCANGQYVLLDLADTGMVPQKLISSTTCQYIPA